MRATTPSPCSPCTPPRRCRPRADELAGRARPLLAAAEEPGADLVVGDLNATPDHAPMRAWRDAGYRDSLELVNAGWSPTWPSNGITPAPGVHPPTLIQIDHVLVGRGSP